MKRDEKQKKSTSRPESSEPTAGTGVAPLWLLAAFALLFYWSTMYVDANSGRFNDQVFGYYASIKQVEDAQPKTEGDFDKATGDRVFNSVCAACHQPSGLGTPGVFPPLVGSEWVQADGPNRLIRIVLHGLTGPVKVKSLDFNNTMVPFGPQLKDNEIAAVLSFIRTKKDWGHSASIVTPEQVSTVRAEEEKRTQQQRSWTVPELEKIPVGK